MKTAPGPSCARASAAGGAALAILLTAFLLACLTAAHAQRVETLLEESREAAQQTQYTRAMEKARAAYARAKTPQERAASLLQQARILLYRSAELPRAYALCEQALRFARVAHDDFTIGESLRWQGLILLARGHAREALPRIEAGLAAIRASHNESEVAYTMLDLGECCFSINDMARARKWFDRAAPLFHNQHDELGEANAARGTARIEIALGATEAGIASLQRARKIFHKIPTSEGWDGEAACLLLEGNASVQVSDFAHAMEVYTQAVPIYQKARNRTGEADCYRDQAILMGTLGDVANAERLLDRAEQIYRAAGNELSLADCWMRRATILQTAGEYSAAAAPMRRAAALYKKLGDRGGMTSAILLEADLAQSEKRFKDVNRLLDDARRVMTELGDRRGLAQCDLWEGQMSYELGDDEASLRQTEAALKAYEEMGDLYNVAYGHFFKARSLARLKHEDEARKEVGIAIDIVERVRTHAGTHTARSGFIQLFEDMYHLAARLALQKGDRDGAFAMAERAQGRSLLDLVAEGGLTISQRMSAQERSRNDQLEQEMAAANDVWAQALASHAPKAEVARLDEARTRARRNLENFEKDVYARHPDVSAVKGAHVLDVAETAAMLPPDALFVDYVVTAQETLVFGISRQGMVYAAALPLKADDVRKKVEQFRAVCARPGGRGAHVVGQSSSPFDAALAASLYDALLKPVLDAVPTPRHLIISPDGPLYEMPFAALRCGDQWLGEKYLVTSAITASLLQSVMRPHAATPQDSVVVFANPDFGDRSWDGHSTTERGGGLAPLPGTQAEADIIRRLFPDAAIYTGDAAQEETAVRELPRYRYVHIATHGLFDTREPLYSALALARPPAGSAYDGFLEARKIAQMRLSADLVVLSACETARGGTGAGDGVLGLLWACTVAGSPSTMVTLWQVDDAATADLMREFYTRLRNGESRGNALWAAQKALLHDGRHGDPYYWAPFVLCGDWR